MLQKQKICAGWDGNPHPAFLWKRINGKGYCKACTSKIEGTKEIKRISKKQEERKQIKKENTKILHNWFNELWGKLPRNKHCTICSAPIYGENLTVYWDHLLEKNQYPELALEERNIVFCCQNCHEAKTNGHPLPKHKELIEQAKKELLYGNNDNDG